MGLATPSVARKVKRGIESFMLVDGLQDGGNMQDWRCLLNIRNGKNQWAFIALYKSFANVVLLLSTQLTQTST